MTAMLRVDLREHEKFDIGGIPSKGTVGAIGLSQVIDLRLFQSQTKSLVGLLQNFFGGLVATVKGDRLQRERAMLREHEVQIGFLFAHDLRHAVVKNVLEARLVLTRFRTKTRDLQTTFNALDVLAQSTDMGDTGSLGTPWRDSSGAREDIENVELAILIAESLRNISDITVVKQLLQDSLLGLVQGLCGMDIVDPLGPDILGADTGSQGMTARVREGNGAGDGNVRGISGRRSHCEGT
ncbi:hypothetical protein BJX96DRAFT_141704 [Aspergillus floccosus]